MRRKILIPLLILILLVLIATIAYGIYYNNKNNNDILNASIKWAKDLDRLYNETTIGTLYHYGYIKDNKTLLLKKNRDCQVIEIYQDKANFKEEENCNLNEGLKKVPIIQIKMTNVSDNTEYRENTWTSSDVKVDVYFKNNQAPINISSMYITLNSQPIITENLIIKADENKIDTYTINLVLEDGSIYTKNFEILIDTTAPTYINTDMSNNDFDAIFEDNESGVEKILYYVSDQETPPSNLEQFLPKEQLELLTGITYNIWAVGVNQAGVYSDITYIGEYNKN